MVGTTSPLTLFVLKMSDEFTLALVVDSACDNEFMLALVVLVDSEVW